MDKYKDETVVLLHGLGGFAKTMYLFERAFKKLGYNVLNTGYLARFRTYDEQVAALKGKLQNQIRPNQRVHFVGHSMGGVLTRGIIEIGHFQNVGAVVTLGSPHQGATWIDKVPGGHFVGRKFFGKKIIDSFCDLDRIQALPHLTPYDVLCVIGTKKFTLANPLSWYVGSYIGDCDGFVPTEGCKLLGSRTWLIPEDHLTMIGKSYVVQETVDHVVRNSEKYRTSPQQMILNSIKYPVFYDRDRTA